jgi:hypothetical protein
MTISKLFFVAATLLFASGLTAQTQLSDNAKVTAVPRLTGIPVCINMTGPMAEKVRKETYGLGSRLIAVGAGSCVGKELALGFFFAQPRKLGQVQESGPGFSNYGTPWLVDAYVVVIKDGEVGDEVARAGGTMLAGQVDSGGSYKNMSPGEAIGRAEKRAIDKLFKKDAWHIGANEVLAREFGLKSTPTSTASEAETQTTPLESPTMTRVDKTNADAAYVLTVAKKVTADARAAKDTKDAQRKADARLAKAYAKLEKAKAAAEKK